MRSIPNIEKSGFERGAYIGYAASGQLWKIRKMGRYWVARFYQANGNPIPFGVYYTAPFLRDFSPLLEKL